MNDVKSWRKGERDRLIAARESVDEVTLEHFRQRIDTHLWHSFPGLATAKLAFCWPIRGEYDARRLAQRLRDRGAVTALPVVVAPAQPLVFREWHPDVALASGPYGIPYPADSDPIVPTAALLPMNGWDEAGFRLGYGSGFFDRTLASLAKKPVVIGVSYELGRMKTIRPQRWDIPMDWVVTERGVYRRDPGRPRVSRRTRHRRAGPARLSGVLRRSARRAVRRRARIAYRAATYSRVHSAADRPTL